MKTATSLFVLVLAAGPALAASPSQDIISSTRDNGLRLLLEEILERNPQIAAASARTAALHRRAPQVSSLPDPQVGITAFLLQPETRVGPQVAGVHLVQRFPGFRKLELREQAAHHEAVLGEAGVEALRLGLVTEGRSLYHEIVFVDAARSWVEQDRATLVHFEELARARYASGVGLQQAVVKIQAEISGVDARLLELAAKRAALVASLNALRDRPSVPVIRTEPPGFEVPALDWQALNERALDSRPELAASQARIARSVTGVDLAERESTPEYSLGLGYTLVGKREDVSNVQDNGKDILGITGAITLPLWRSRLEAGIDEAVQSKLAAEADRRAVTAEIQRALAELQGTIPEIERRVRLFEDTLLAQTEHSLASAEAAYGAGTVDALALLDARRVLLEVRIASTRARTDLAVALARLEGAIAGPITRGENS